MNLLLFFAFVLTWSTGLGVSIPLFLLGIFLIKHSLDIISQKY